MDAKKFFLKRTESESPENISTPEAYDAFIIQMMEDYAYEVSHPTLKEETQEKKYEFTYAEITKILPQYTGIHIKWGCKGYGFGQLEIIDGRVDREYMSDEFIMSLFKFLEQQENSKPKIKEDEL